MAKIVLTDTCFWLGLIDPTDQYHEMSNNIAPLIDGYPIIFPWPCLYETISTHLARRRERLLYLEEFIKKPDIILFDDSVYKATALQEVFHLNRIAGFTYSLTDGVIREILKDIDVKVNYLVTFNNSDFEDLAEAKNVKVCGILWILDELVRLNVTTPGETMNYLKYLMGKNKRLPLDECAKRMKAWEPG